MTMLNSMDPTIAELLKCIRRLAHTYGQHSASVKTDAGISAPQLLLMHAINDLGNVPAKALAKEISVTPGTATAILQQLEKGGLAQRARTASDRRIISVQLTDKGKAVLAHAPPLLHQNFIAEFQRLKASEKSSLLYCFQRVTELMESSIQPEAESRPTLQKSQHHLAVEKTARA